MTIEHNHDDYEIVVRVMTSKGQPSSAYIVPSWDNLTSFKGDTYDRVKQHLENNDNKPF